MPFQVNILLSLDFQTVLLVVYTLDAFLSLTKITLQELVHFERTRNCLFQRKSTCLFILSVTKYAKLA